MRTPTLVSPEEYLRTSFENPDREYADGQIIERPLGNRSHSRIQLRLLQIFSNLGSKAPLFPYPELRLRLSASQFRIPDVAVFAERDPVEEVPSHPAYIVIEIISPDDRHSDMMEKLELYRNWGVAHVWVVDPRLQRMWTYGSSGLSDVGSFVLPEYGIEIAHSELFEPVRPL